MISVRSFQVEYIAVVTGALTASVSLPLPLSLSLSLSVSLSRSLADACVLTCRAPLQVGRRMLVLVHPQREPHIPAFALISSCLLAPACELYYAGSQHIDSSAKLTKHLFFFFFHFPCEQN